MKKYITKDILSKINFFFKILKKLLIKHPYLDKLKVKKIESILSKNSFDLDYSLKKNPNSELIWGEGEIRFLIQK